MKLVYCKHQDIGRYIRFTKEIYKDYPSYKDNMTPLLTSILYKRNNFCKYAQITPVMVLQDEQVVAVSTYIGVERMPQVLQIAFFEALPNKEEAVDLIVAEAIRIAKEKEIQDVLIGMNGHPSYGLGILSDHFEEDMSYGSAYNPPYYIDYFRSYAAEEYTLTSYLTDLRDFSFEKQQKLIDRVKRQFTYRPIDYRRFEQEVRTYNTLNNTCFQEHPFYYPRTLEEDRELFYNFRQFGSPENIIIAEKQGKPIGYMLWYPDFNERIPSQKSSGVQGLFRNGLFPPPIRKCKLVAMGVLPEYQGRGAILGLFDTCFSLIRGKYDWCESSWILDTNLKSKGFGIRLADQEYKHYKVFQMHI